MKVYIYHDNSDGRVFPYTVMSKEEWPWGTVETVCMTKRGARHAAKRIAKRGEPKKTLVEVVGG